MQLTPVFTRGIHMKLSMEQAAYAIGKSKKTIYNHKDANKFSWEINDDGNAVIDVSELLRVYGTNDGIPERLEELQSGGDVKSSENTQNYTPKNVPQKASSKDDDYIELVKLREEKKYRDEKITLLEEEKEKWEKLAQDAQATVQRVTLLLEDHTDKGEKEDNWSKSLKALENRIANQEKSEKEREERERKLVDENKRIRQAYSKQKRELEAEKSKSLWKRLFG